MNDRFDDEDQRLNDLAKARAHALWPAAVALLAKDQARNLKAILDTISSNPTAWVVPYHMNWGMGIRNLLRRHGFGEEAFGILNLDNVYAELVEEATRNL